MMVSVRCRPGQARTPFGRRSVQSAPSRGLHVAAAHGLLRPPRRSVATFPICRDPPILEALLRSAPGLHFYTDGRTVGVELRSQTPAREPSARERVCKS